MHMIISARGELDASPTVINHAIYIGKTGNDVTIITSVVSKINKMRLQKMGIQIIELGNPCKNANNVVAKALKYLHFRYKFWKAYKVIVSDDKRLWVSRIDTAIALGGKLTNNNYILVLHELHDAYKLHLKAIRYYSKYANKIVVMENCRGAIMKCWYGWEKYYVIPNKPAIHPRKKNLKIEGKYNKYVNSEKKILLYQGALTSDRKIEPMISALNVLKENFQMVIMGRDVGGKMELLRQINPDIKYVNWISPPFHLEITSYAYIGICVYDYDSLNSIFCAPNKIWEYAGYGIPILAQNVPGLMSTVEANRAGKCVDINSQKEIVQAINSIDERYDYYSANAKRLYDSVNNYQIVQDILSHD